MRKFLLLLLAFSSLASAQLSPDVILVSNDRVKITAADFEAEIARIPESDRGEFLQSRQRIAALLENILMNRVLAEEARALKLDQDPKVQAEIRNQTEKVLAKYRGQRYMKDLKPRDHTAAAKEIYLTEPTKSTLPAAYKVWHVLVAVKPGRDSTQAQKRAEEARQRVLLGYDDLDAIARQFSDDPSAAKNGGVLDMLRESELDGTFAAAVKKLKPGETSPVIQTKFGFHVINLLELLPEKKTKFEELRSQLIEEARINYEKANYEAHLARIREDPSLKLNAEALDAIRTKVPESFKPTYEPPATIKAPPRKPVAAR